MSISDYSQRDLFFMQLAIAEARKALVLGEMPIGCVIVSSDLQICATGYNRNIIDHDPTHHAEIVATSMYCQSLKNYRFPKETTMYVTLEPCMMCVGALLHARLTRLVVGARDSRAHSIHQTVDLFAGKHFNHKISVEYGVCELECQELLTSFFKERR
ncbi:MAG: nucleoside deaminase [Gammaproteobacteria bacterium]|nr:nucleoside deaminase [Gammaproteobacteria bacterium]